jgi:hydroxymethylglutaryl-CoA synthase
MEVGIDKINFYTPSYYLDMKTLAKFRNTDPNKYLIGLGQEKMSVLPPNEDIVTMGAAAAKPIIDNINKAEKAEIDFLIFATESSIDQSKSAGIYAHTLLDLKKECRTIEIKQACYSGTAALKLAATFIKANPDSKVLIIASDVSRYGFGTPGEATQGCGACAMLITKNPSILKLNEEAGFITKDVMDFWRPNYMSEALVDGHYSTKLYLKSLLETYKIYETKSGRELTAHEKFCYHLPFTKMADKAHKKLFLTHNLTPNENQISASLIYNKLIGNSYTASLYISFISLLDNTQEDLSNERIGFYSYGSGAVAEFFSGIITQNYQQHLFKNMHQEMLATRKELDYKTYEVFYDYHLHLNKYNLSQIFNIKKSTSPFIYLETKNHKRIYKKNHA